MDTKYENCIFVEKDNIVRKFITSTGGLYFHDLWNDELCFPLSEFNFENKNNMFMQSQKENSEWYTKRQVDRAKTARNLYQMMMFPSINDFKNEFYS